MAGAESAPEGIDAAIARVGRAVTGRRLELGLATQRELAEKAGVAVASRDVDGAASRRGTADRADAHAASGLPLPRHH